MKSKLSLYPQSIDNHNWYYEEKKGIILVHEVIIEGKYFRTDQILIPNRLLKNSFKRMEP